VVKRRVVFTLLWDRGHFMLSRNFRLQKVGDLKWLSQNYNFPRISTALDELVVLNVSRGEGSVEAFAADLTDLTRGVFLPVAAGGGIRTETDAALLLRSGADKLTLNAPLHSDPDLVGELAARYGSQCLVASVDFTRAAGDSPVAAVDGGRVPLDEPLRDTLTRVEALGVGDVLLHSIDRDGTGQGFDCDVQSHFEELAIPVILSGGAGHSGHFLDAFRKTRVQGLATAHLFNFIGDALPNSRRELLEDGVRIAVFSDVPALAGEGAAPTST